MRLLKQFLTIAALSLAVLVPAIGQMPGGGPMPAGAKKVPGEKWRTKTSMEMQGMSMPSRTMEVCVPVGKANEQLAKPDDKNCTMYDMSTTGNTFRGKIRCTGENAMEGEIESTTIGSTIKGTMHVRMKSRGEMTMRTESTKLGACEAVDLSNVKLPTIADPMIEICAKAGRDIEAAPYKVRDLYPNFVKQTEGVPSCASYPAKKIFCEAVQGYSGFTALRIREAAFAKEPSNKKTYKAQPWMLTPPATSLEVCGLGKGAPAVEALRTKLLAKAEESKQWVYMLVEGGQPEQLRLQALAKEHCTGRGFTSTSSKAHKSLCQPYGPDLIAGRFDRAKQTAMFGENSGDDSSDSSSEGSGSSGSNGDASGTSADDPKKSKTQDAVDKGKKLLRGILGR